MGNIDRSEKFTVFGYLAGFAGVAPPASGVRLNASAVSGKMEGGADDGRK